MRIQGTGYTLQDLSSQKTTGEAGKANATSDPEDAKLKQACKDFESIFLGYVLKGMRKTVSKSELMGSNKEEEMFQDMMDDEICKSAADKNTVGIADALYKQLSAEMKQYDINRKR